MIFISHVKTWLRHPKMLPLRGERQATQMDAVAEMQSAQ